MAEVGAGGLDEQAHGGFVDGGLHPAETEGGGGRQDGDEDNEPAALAEDATAGAILGSIAAAIECEREGNVPVTAQDVLARLDEIENEVTFARA